MKQKIDSVNGDLDRLCRPKIEEKKMVILSVMLATLGHFSRFSPDDHLDICLIDHFGTLDPRYFVLCI